MVKIPCDECGQHTERKHTGKIRGRSLCKKCRVEVRKNHRNETTSNNSEEEKEKVKDLSKKLRQEYNRKNYVKRRKVIETPPKIKGSTLPKKKRQKVSSYITFQERQNLFRMLVGRGLNADEAKERIGTLMDEQKRVRELMRDEDKSEDEIKNKQQKLLEELWNY